MTETKGLVSTKTLIGEGKLADALHEFDGRRVLLVTTEGNLRRFSLLTLLNREGRKVESLLVSPNPELQFLEKATAKIKTFKADAVVGIGGGSAMDAAKVLSLTLLSNLENPLGVWLRRESSVEIVKNLPLLLSPTTAGTGAEVTPFATVWNAIEKKKYSLASEKMRAQCCVLDPSLTLGLPFDETLYGGLDAMTHALETLWNQNADKEGIQYANEALWTGVPTLRTLIGNFKVTSRNISLREKMLISAHLAGMAISKSKTGFVHAMSYPLTLRFGVPHGLACGWVLKTSIDRVNKFHCWAEGADREIISVLGEMLGKFELFKEIAKFVDPRSLYSCIPEMFNAERFANSLYQPNGEEIREMIKESLA